METIPISEHKNYLPSYPFTKNELIEEFFIPNMKGIFSELTNKIISDAEKDGERGRNFLKEQGEKASIVCERISDLSKESGKKHSHKILVEELINMDYASVADFFGLLAKYYDENSTINQELKTLENLFQSMRKVSEKHVKIISKELVDTLSDN